MTSSHLVGAWGITTTFSGFMQSYGGLIGVRLVLGFCEGGLLPGMVRLTTFIYPPHP
jgi:MFS family permease